MEEHLEHLDKELQISSFKLNKSKCVFLLPKIGHIIDESGLHPMQEKVKAFQETPAPKNLVKIITWNN